MFTKLCLRLQLTLLLRPELHQLTSPTTAHGFLNTLLDSSSAVKTSLDELGLFASYVGKSWAGIIRSRSFL